MSKSVVVFLLLVATGAAQAQPACSDAEYRTIESRVITGDGHGHGPDLGSVEWKSVIEFKLGIRGQPDVPRRDSDAWCRYLNQALAARDSAASSAQDRPWGPAYHCDTVRPGSIEALVCSDKDLSALDRKLTEVYAAATKKAINEHPPQLQAEQRGWIKGRNDCWKSDDKKICVRTEYQRRIAELQARYRLVAGKGPVRYVCDGNPANEVVATFFPTESPALIAERGDSVSLMYLQPSGSGTKYQGRNTVFWEHQGEALITWGYGAAEMRCEKKP